MVSLVNSDRFLKASRNAWDCIEVGGGAARPPLSSNWQLASIKADIDKVDVGGAGVKIGTLTRWASGGRTETSKTEATSGDDVVGVVGVVVVVVVVAVVGDDDAVEEEDDGEDASEGVC